MLPRHQHRGGDAGFAPLLDPFADALSPDGNQMNGLKAVFAAFER
jgi:hypothetical protein